MLCAARVGSLGRCVPQLAQRRGLIQMQTMLQTVDNTGVKELYTIRIHGTKKLGEMGDMATVSIREIRMRKNIGLKKGDMAQGLIVQTRHPLHRKDGQTIKFLKNACVLLDKQKKPIGSRVSGPILKEFRKLKNHKFINLSSNVI